jgi:hypothetical protein
VVISRRSEPASLRQNRAAPSPLPTRNWRLARTAPSELLEDFAPVFESLTSWVGSNPPSPQKLCGPQNLGAHTILRRGRDLNPRGG